MTENNFSFTPMANEDISIHIGSVPGAVAESGAPAALASPVSAQHQEAESIFGEIPAVPTQEAVDGILFDFNDGIRILFPQNRKEYHVVFSDIETGVILFSQDTVSGAFITSVKKFYICFRLVIYEKGGKEPLFTHDFDARDKEVMIQIPVGTLGDSIGWFSYVERFQQKHRCKLICVMNQWIIDIVKNQYPDIVFITPAQTKNYKPYACYHMGLFFRGDVDHQPIDFRYIGLHRTAGYILGVDPADEPPRFDLSAPRRIREKYVCIACQSSSQAKYWNNPYGWDEVIKFLKDNGYRVFCIDKERVHGAGLVWNHMPWGVEDETGDKPLQERIDLIKDADFFIGLSSGLSWLAWGCKVPVVMISGFTHPTNEFTTPYRVINYHTCHSCWNDMRLDFDHFDFLWCPRHKGTDRHFECSKLISAAQVITTIKKIPTFQPLQAESL